MPDTDPTQNTGRIISVNELPSDSVESPVDPNLLPDAPPPDEEHLQRMLEGFEAFISKCDSIVEALFSIREAKALCAAARKGLASEAYIDELRARCTASDDLAAAVHKDLIAEKERADRCWSILKGIMAEGGTQNIFPRIEAAMQHLGRE